jgi:hypothetical protein
LVRHLLAETFGHLLVPFVALKRSARQIILALIDRELRLTHPVGRFLFAFLLLLLQHVLVGDGNGHLSLDLEELVLHIKD